MKPSSVASGPRLESMARGREGAVLSHASSPLVSWELNKTITGNYCAQRGVILTEGSFRRGQNKDTVQGGQGWRTV